MPKFLEVTAKPDAKNYLNLEVSVKDHGATGNGSTDDTAALHAARDAAGAGGTILVPPGTYLVDGLTASVSDQVWKLADGAVIKMKLGATWIFKATAENVTVSGGVFDGSTGTDGETQQGVHAVADGFTIRGSTVKDTPGYGIRTDDCNHITITECEVTNTGFEAIFVKNGIAAPSNIYDIKITNNLVDNSGSAKQYASGIYVRGEAVDRRANRVAITGNIIRVPYEPSYEGVGSIIVFNATDCIVSENQCYGAFIGISCVNANNTSISSNTVMGWQYVGIEIPGTISAVNIVGNVINPDDVAALPAGQAGIQTSAGTVSDAVITGNTITGFPSGPAYGVFFNSGSTVKRALISLNAITANVSSGTFKGIATNTGVENVTITGNVIDANSTSMSAGVEFVGAVNGAAISANSFANLARNVLILAAASAVTVDKIYFFGNGLNNCGPTLLNALSGGATLGTSNVFDFNPPKLSAIHDTNGNTAVDVAATSSAVNFVRVINGATGQPAQIAASGSDTNVNLYLRPRGNAGYVFATNSNGATVARFGTDLGATNPANFWVLNPATAGNVPSLQVAGTDASISMNLVTKNAGTVQANGNPVGVKVAVPASAGATGVVGQWAAESGWLYICVAANTWERVAIASW